MKIRLVLIMFIMIFMVWGLSGQTNLEKIHQHETGYSKGGEEAISHFMYNFKNDSYDGEPMDFSFLRTNFQDFILFIGMEAKLKIKIRGKKKYWITAELKQIPWDFFLGYLIHKYDLNIILIENNTTILIYEKE